MATFKYGRALLCALLSLTLAASCGPGEDHPDGGPADGGDGGQADSGIGPNDPSVITLHAPPGVHGAAFYEATDRDWWMNPVPIPGCESTDSCPSQVLGSNERFAVRHPDYRVVPKWSEFLRMRGHTYELRWDGPGECGIAVGEEGSQGHWPYRDPDHPERDQVFFQTSIIEEGQGGRVVLNDLNVVGATKILSGDNFVVVTGLTFSGRYVGSNGGQEVSGTISNDREEIVYRIRGLDASGQVTGEEWSGTFHRFHQ